MTYRLLLLFMVSALHGMETKKNSEKCYLCFKVLYDGQNPTLHIPCKKKHDGYHFFCFQLDKKEGCIFCNKIFTTRMALIKRKQTKSGYDPDSDSEYTSSEDESASDS